MPTRVSPRWPRTLRATPAAEYAGYPSAHAYLGAVADGTMPAPFTIAGADAWDILEIDAAIDALKAGGSIAHDWRKEAEAYATTRRVAGRRC